MNIVSGLDMDGSVRMPNGKSQVAIGFLSYYGTDHPREANGPLGYGPHSRSNRTPRVLTTLEEQLEP